MSIGQATGSTNIVASMSTSLHVGNLTSAWHRIVRMFFSSSYFRLFSFPCLLLTGLIILKCQACETQSRDDFYLLLLTSMEDDAASYEHLKSIMH